MFLMCYVAEYWVYSKGAETSMIPRGIAGDKDKIMSAVCDYAIEGLRTLVIAHRRITEAEYQDYDRQLNEAKLSLTDREKMVCN